MDNLEWYNRYCEQFEENIKLAKRLDYLENYSKSLETANNRLQNNMDDRVQKEAEKLCIPILKENEELRREVEHLRALLNADGTNSGIPTSQTPINKKKVIPNSRKKSGKKKGGQLNHKKHSLQKFNDDEVTDVVEHNVEECPVCGGDMIPTGNFKNKDEYEITIKTKKIRHVFNEMQCTQCGEKVMMEIPANLKEENQYGSHVQALALTLMNEGFVSMRRTSEIINGLTNKEIDLSDGFIAKLQKRLSKNLKPFYEELKLEIIKLHIVYWDDTVIMISTNRGCLRFYGDELFALYAAHMKKDKAGLDEDGILNAFNEDTYVVHDHNKINYNECYVFINVECCVHLLRDLKKVVDNLDHEWAKLMINLLVKTNKQRNDNEEYDEQEIYNSYDAFVEQGYQENEKDSNAYYADTEKTLLKRLVNYKSNYLMWVGNVDIPFTNNLSERSLRNAKTKMKISGQFNNLNTADAYAVIKSYLETGKRHGYDVIELIVRALEGNYVTIEEMKKHNVLN